MVTDRAVLADALAKGVFILGPDAGMALVERLPHVDAVIVSATERGVDFEGAEAAASRPLARLRMRLEVEGSKCEVLRFEVRETLKSEI